MADPRFFSVSHPLSLAQLAEIAGAEVLCGALDMMFEDVQPLSEAQVRHVSFLDNKKYTDQFSVSEAGACVVSPEMADRAPEGMALLAMDNPYLGYAKIAQAFYGAKSESDLVSDHAIIAESAILGTNVTIAPGVVIGENVEIGDHCRIDANSVIGEGCVIGDGSRICANVTISHALLGKGVTIFPGARIGQDGFGFAISPTGAVKVPQLGRVIIEDGVEIGANTTIDRGAGPDTVIGAGTMIDNLVQVAHNVRIGRHCAIAAQVGISGSTEIGDGVMIGGQAGFAGHMKVGDGAQIGAQSGLFRDVAPGARVGGTPAKPMRQWMREQAVLDKMTKKGK